MRLIADKIQADAKRIETQLKQSMPQINIPLGLDTKALQASLDAFAKTIKPINVPINPVWTGMPAMPGGGGMGGLPMGSASPNLAYYFGGLQQQMQGMMPTSSPNWSYLLAQGGGGGGGQPRQPQGRMAGIQGLFRMAMIARAAADIGSAGYESARAGYYSLSDSGAEMTDTSAIQSRRERLDHHGKIERFTDTEKQYDTRSAGAVEAGQKAIRSLPLLGDAIEGVGHGIYRFISASKNLVSGQGFESDESKAGTTRALQEVQEKHIELMRDQNHMREEANRDLTKETIRTTNERFIADQTPGQRRMSEIVVQRQLLDNKFATEGSYHQGFDTSKPLTPEAAAALASAVAGLTAMYDRAARDNEREHGLRMTGVADERTALAERTAGDPDASASRAFASRQNRRLAQLQATDPEAAAEFKDLMPGLQKEHDDDRKRARLKTAQDLAAEIGGIQQNADNEMLRAHGEVYAADENALRQSIDHKVAQLNREAAATKDTTEAYHLRFLAKAVADNGAISISARAEAAERHAESADRVSRRDAEVTNLEAHGQHRAARQASIEAKYKDELDQIDPTAVDAVQKFDAAQRRRQGNLDLAGRDDKLTSEGRQLRAYQSNAEFTGDNASGSIMALRVRARHEFEDANGDIGAQHDVTRENLADLRNLRRSLSPRVRRSADGEQFSHDLGNAIGEGPFNADAKKLFDKTEKELGAGAVSNDLPAASAKMEKAAEKLDKAADKLGGRTLAVLDSH